MHPLLRDTSVLVPQRQLLGLGPGRDEGDDLWRELVQVHIPQPGEVFAVHGGVAMRREDVLGAGPLQVGAPRPGPVPG